MVEGGQAPLAQVVDEVLDVAALDLRELPVAERGDDIRAQQRLVAASRGRLVRLALTVEDGAVVGAGDQMTLLHDA